MVHSTCQCLEMCLGRPTTFWASRRPTNYSAIMCLYLIMHHFPKEQRQWWFIKQCLGASELYQLVATLHSQFPLASTPMSWHLTSFEASLWLTLTAEQLEIFSIVWSYQGPMREFCAAACTKLYHPTVCRCLKQAVPWHIQVLHPVPQDISMTATTHVDVGRHGML